MLLFIHTNMIVVGVRVLVGRGVVLSAVTYLLKGIVLIYMLYSLARRREIGDVLVICMVYGLSLAVSLALNPVLAGIAKATLRSFLSCVEGYWLFSRMGTSDVPRRLLPYCAALMIPYCAIILTSTTIDHYLNSDYFAVSYGMVIPLCIVVLYGYRNPLYVGIFLLGTSVVLFAGARGAFACVIGAVAIFLALRVCSLHGIRRFLIITLIAAGAFVVLRYAEEAAEALYQVMPESRTMARLLSDNAGYDNSRLEMYRRLWLEVEGHPFRYRGILSDRIVGADVWHMYDVESLSATYAHNFFLEILYAHGVIVGGVMLITFAWLLAKALFASFSIGVDAEALLATLCGCGFIQLMYSSSYLINQHFWCFVGAMIAVLLKWREATSQDAPSRRIQIGRLR